jgi:hypothetical protein
MPYVIVLCACWGTLFDMHTSLPAQLYVRDSRQTSLSSHFAYGAAETWYLVGVSIVAPLVLFYLVRVGYAFVMRDRGRFRVEHDRCPSCDYRLDGSGDIRCPECGVVSTLRDRTRMPQWMNAVRDRAWVRRFTLAVILGVVSGPALCMLESGLAIKFARRAFAQPLPATFMVAPNSDWDPPVSGGRLTYVDHVGGRLFFNHWDDSDVVHKRKFRVARVLPWRFFAHKYVTVDLQVFSYY